MRTRLALTRTRDLTRPLAAAVALLLLGAFGAVGQPVITAFSPTGSIAWSNAYPTGVCCVLTAPTPVGPWSPWVSTFTTNSRGQLSLPATPPGSFSQLMATDVSAGNPSGFGNLTGMYGRLSTVAGNGAGGTDTVNYWQPSFEGAYATNVALSRPHFALIDLWGNVIILDKDSHSVLKVTSDGRIHTVAGTHVMGNGPDTASPATNVALNYPNGLWMGPDGAVYILDTGNGKVRWFDTNGVMTTLLTDSAGISGGRGLWVRADRGLAYFVNGGHVEKWTPPSKIIALNTTSFNDPGNLFVKTNGDLLVTDRGAGRVYLLSATTGATTPLFGNGGTNRITDGVAATASSLFGVRAVWPFPAGGWLVGMQDGSQAGLVDAAGTLHLLVNGYEGYHSGDGQWFYSPGYKISEVRSITMDGAGNIWIVESDNGYVRRIQFLPLTP